MTTPIWPLWAKKIGAMGLELVYPSKIRCMGCGGEIMPDSRFGLCNTCYKEMPFVKGHQCRICGVPNIPNHADHCMGCQRYIGLLDGGFSALCYEDLGRTLIQRFKYHDARYLSQCLGELMADQLAATYQRDVDYLVYVPCHPKRMALRGFNQAQCLAEVLSKKSGVPLIHEALIRVEDTKRSSNLSRDERFLNMRSAFKRSPESKAWIRGKRIGVVDDIFTTGTTMGCCAILLKEAGAKAVYSFSAAVRKK